MRILIFLAIMIWASSLYAQPFLVSDPTTENVTEYQIVEGGNTITSPSQDLGDGTVRLYHDEAGILDGQHNIEVRACNMWGCSSEVPFSFVKQLLGVPTGIGLQK